LKLECDEPLSNVATNFSVRRYSKGNPYLTKFRDFCGNYCQREVPRSLAT
jgi:hypothetical protein